MNAPSNKLQDILKELPGMRNPKDLPLAEEGWSSGHSVISTDHYWEVVDEWTKTDAEGRLVVQVEKRE